MPPCHSAREAATEAIRHGVPRTGGTNGEAPTTHDRRGRRAHGGDAARDHPWRRLQVVVDPYDANGAIPGSGKGERIGYISPSIESGNLPVVKPITDSINEQAAIAGVELAQCSAFVAYECSPTFRKGRVNGSKGKAAGAVIAFDIGQRESSFCSFYRKLPTIAIENHQSPCEVAFMGPDDREAGRPGGAASGRYAKDKLGLWCHRVCVARGCCLDPEHGPHGRLP